jgi:GH15 family glucan-1,4-alpha-glucosidase
MAANDPRFQNTLKAILKPKDRGGLTENNLVYRYDTDKVDDGTGGGGSLRLLRLYCRWALTQFVSQRREAFRWSRFGSSRRSRALGSSSRRSCQGP